IRHEQILRARWRNLDADGGAAQIPHGIGVTGATGVGKADRDRVLLAWLKVPDPKRLWNFGKNPKPGVGHTEQHFRVRGALDAIRPGLLMVAQLNAQNVAGIAFKDALLGLWAATGIGLRPGLFGHRPAPRLAKPLQQRPLRAVNFATRPGG